MVVCSKLIIFKKEWVGKTGAGGEIKENEIVSRSYVAIKRKITEITLEFFEIKWRTKEEDCRTIRKRKDRDREKDKRIKRKISKEAEGVNIKEEIEIKRRLKDWHSKQIKILFWKKAT